MADPVTVVTLELPIQGDGSALMYADGTSTFGLTKVELKDAAKGAFVMWVPDPDNSDNTIFWVQDPTWSPSPDSGTYTLLLSYPAE